RHHPHLHPFPTRRSSDLTSGACWPRRGRRSPTDHVVRWAAVLAVLGLLTTAAPSRSDPAPRLRVVTFNLFHGGPTSGLWGDDRRDRKSTRLNSSHRTISY